ncbi:MAG: DUF411 domain-containing protein [Ghiorsea sp.]
MKIIKNEKVVFGFVVASALLFAEMTNTSSAKEVIMYKNVSCECCGGWADHLRKAGYKVDEKPREDMDAIKSKYDVSEKLASCHTAIIDGYVIEGHVPAEDIDRLLSERPDIIGLSAPGMPMQSPGMQQEESKPKNYDILTISKDGKPKVYKHYE